MRLVVKGEEEGARLYGLQRRLIHPLTEVHQTGASPRHSGIQEDRGVNDMGLCVCVCVCVYVCVCVCLVRSPPEVHEARTSPRHSGTQEDRGVNDMGLCVCVCVCVCLCGGPRMSPVPGALRVCVCVCV